MGNIKRMLALIIFFTASLVFTFPLIFNMNSFISVFGAGDGFQYVWNAHIFWQQLLSGQSLFFTKIVFYPIGVNLAFHDYSPLTNLILGLFRDNLVRGMNVLILLAFTLASFTAFLLIKSVTKNYLLSIVAGLVYGFSPVMFSYLLTEHYYYLFASPYLPLNILIVFKFFQKREMRYFLLLILVFWLVFFTSYYMSIIYVLVAVTLFLTKMLICFLQREKLFSLSKIKALFALIIILIIVPAATLFLSVFNIRDIQNYRVSESLSANSCNADLLGYLIPDIAVPHLQNISFKLSNKLGYQWRGDTPSYYIGLFYLSLAVISFIKFRKKSDVFAVAIVGVVILLLSLGTIVRIGNFVVLEGAGTSFYWFSKLPFLGFIGCPVRFPIVVLLLVIFLSFFLINTIIKKYKVSNTLSCVMLVVLFLFEYGIPNIQFSSTAIPEVYRLIAQGQDNLTVLELPSGLTEGYGYFGFDYSIRGLNGMQMYWQTLYQRPRIGGYISRIPATTYKFFKEEPIISNIFEMTNYKSSPMSKSYSKTEVLEFIKKFNIGYIVFSPGERQYEYISAMENLLKDVHYQKIEKEGFVLMRLN